MAIARSFFNGFLSLFLLLFLHLGCFFLSPTPNPNPDQQQSPPKRRKISPLSPSLPSCDSVPKPRKSLSLPVRSYLGRLFSSSSSSSSRKTKEDRSPHPLVSPPSPIMTKPIPLSPDKAPSGSKTKMPAADQHSSFTSRGDIFPCSACGEVLSKPHLLDHHQTTHHSLSELPDAGVIVIPKPAATPSPFLFFSFLFYSSSPASSSSRLFFTAAVAPPAGEGRPNPTGRCPASMGAAARGSVPASRRARRQARTNMQEPNRLPC